MNQEKYNTSLVIRFVFWVLISFTFNKVFAEENKENESIRTSDVKTEQETKVPHSNIGKRSRIKTLEEFIPSEKVSADKPVAFPSDI